MRYYTNKYENLREVDTFLEQKLLFKAESRRKRKLISLIMIKTIELVIKIFKPRWFH